MTDLYPLALKLDGRLVLVVGGGSVATRRVPALLAAGARVRLVSPSVTPALRGLADAGRLEWIERRFEEADIQGVWLIQVAVDDPGAAAEISRLAQERQIFCVRADDRHAASAWTPAVTRHGPVTVAVLAGGDPRRAMSVRDQLADLLAATAIAPMGAEQAEHTHPSAPAGTTTARPAEVDGAAPGATGGGAASASDSVGAGLPARGDAVKGTVALVGGGPGDPELITVKGRRLLNAADVVVADRLAPGLLLDELRPEVELIDVAKLPYGPAAQQDEINRILVDRARQGLFVVRLKGGDPYVFGRGGEEAIACAEAGVAVMVVPGVTSAIAVPAVAGVPVTHRGVTHDFTVVSGHLAPDDPGSLVNWPALAKLNGTLIILMGLRQLPSIVDTLVANGRDAATPAAIVQEGTTQYQHVVRGKLADLPTLADGLRPPAIVVIGEVVSTLEGLEH
jgi:uroporphyrin-III C-methyltransferase/precorrin-2 dehydrogenase/sirohydrochlorin ferrochelatase